LPAQSESEVHAQVPGTRKGGCEAGKKPAGMFSGGNGIPLERVEIERSPLKYTIRPCQKLEDLAELVMVQQKICGYAGHELYPLRLFVTLKRIGGRSREHRSPNAVKPPRSAPTPVGSARATARILRAKVGHHRIRIRPEVSALLIGPL